jgi:AcrR family transcriptional regulator
MSSMKSEAPDKRAALLAAAQDCFLLYGFKRTSMDDIAQRAGMSRAALYLLFPNKEAIFRTLSEQLHDAALARAEAALRSDEPLEQRLVGAFEGKHLELFELVQRGAHGGELMDLSHGLGADIAQRTEDAFLKLLTAAFHQAAAQGALDLKQLGLEAPGCADLLMHAAQGFNCMPPDIPLYRRQIAQLVRVFCAALAPAKPAR